MNTTKTALIERSQSINLSQTKWKVSSALILSSTLLVGCGGGSSDSSSSGLAPANTTTTPPANETTEISNTSAAAPSLVAALAENEEINLTSEIMPKLVLEVAAAGNDFIKFSETYMPAIDDGYDREVIYSPSHPDSALTTTKNCIESGNYVFSFNRLPEYIDTTDQVVHQAGDITTVEWNDCVGVIPGSSVYYSGNAVVSVLEGFYGGGVRSSDVRWREDYAHHMHRAGTNGLYLKYLDGDITIDLEEKVVNLSGDSLTRLDRYNTDISLEQHFYQLSDFNLVLTNTYQWTYWTSDDLTLDGTAQLNGSMLDGIIDITFNNFSSEGITLESRLEANGTVQISSGNTNAEIEFVDGSYTWRLDTNQDGDWDWEDTGAF